MPRSGCQRLISVEIATNTYVLECALISFRGYVKRRGQPVIILETSLSSLSTRASASNTFVVQKLILPNFAENSMSGFRHLFDAEGSQVSTNLGGQEKLVKLLDWP